MSAQDPIKIKRSAENDSADERPNNVPSHPSPDWQLITMPNPAPAIVETSSPT